MKRRRWAALAVFVCVLAGMWGYSGNRAAQILPLSMMSEAECASWLSEREIALPDGLERADIQGILADTERMTRFNPYFFREIEDPAAADFLEEVSFAVCRYYNWAVMRGYRVLPWSEDQETFAAWLSDNGITVPEVLEGTDLRQTAAAVEACPDLYQTAGDPAAVDFLKALRQAISKFHWETALPLHRPFLSAMGEEEAVQWLASWNITVPEELAGMDILGLIAELEKHPAPPVVSWDVLYHFSEDVCQAVYFYYGWTRFPIEKQPLFAMSEEDCRQWIADRGISIPASLRDPLLGYQNLDIKSTLADLEIDPYSYTGYDDADMYGFYAEISRAVCDYHGWESYPEGKNE